MEGSGPCHDDENPSLSVSDGKNGRVLVHCHAGCSQSDVIVALVELGLWTNGTRPKRSTMKTPIIPVPADAPPMSFKHPKYCAPSRVWPYHPADDELAGYIARFDFMNDGTARQGYFAGHVLRSRRRPPRLALEGHSRCRGRSTACPSYWADRMRRYL